MVCSRGASLSIRRDSPRRSLWCTIFTSWRRWINHLCSNWLTSCIPDATLTSKVLRVANSVHCNPSQEPIRTISRAIVLIGLVDVRLIDLTVSHLRGEQARRPDSPYRSRTDPLAPRAAPGSACCSPTSR
ncbi:HDOD domain-containing protein [Pseudomonas boanensis]|uniref:HDOD domain-containing protein n=1 Tax=Metapseudomonas boanensis TaxID=2822138 RepID=UPI0035D3ECCD